MANFQVNRNALQAAVNRNTKTNTSKKSKVDKNKEKLMRQQEQASRKSQQPIYNITPTPLNVQQSRNNLEAARKAQAMSKNNLDSFLNRGGVSTNAVDRTKRIIAGNVIRPENKKITPISEAKGSKNIYNTITPANASQALHIEQQKRQELMDTDEGTMLSNSYRNASNTVAYEKYNYNQKLLEGQNKFNIADKTVGSLIRGVTSLFDNMDAENFITDENGNRRKLSSYSDMKQQKLQQSQSLPGRLVSSTLNNLGRILGSTAIDTATLGVGGKAIYWGDTFFDTYNQNLNEGYDEGDSATSAFLTTALGAVIDKMIGSAAVNAVGNVEAKGLEDIISSALTKKGVSNTLANYLSSMSSEGISEFIEEYADAYINKFTLDKSTDPADYINLIVETFPAALEAGAVGSLSGAVGSVNDQIQDKRTVASLNKYITTLENFEPSSPQEANMKEEALSDALQQRDELQQKWGTNEKNTKETLKKQTFAEMEQEATEALEKRKQEQTKKQTAPTTSEQVNEITTQEAKTEETASKEETRSEVASKEEPPKAKVSKPLNFREALTNYEVENILQQINTYNQEQIEKNLITTERVKESYDNNKINLAYATLVMKSNNASDFSQRRAENYFKSLSKKLSDTDKNYVYRNLDKTNYKLAEMAEKYFAPTEKQDTSVQETKPTYTKAKNIQQEKGYTAYYSVPSDDIIERGTKRASDISQEELDSGKIDLITYNTDDTRNVYEFDNKTELNKYIKSIGGYSAFEGNYTIMSNTKEGEFYYTRDKSSQGGWIWRDANNDLVKGWMSKSKIKETRETAKTNYNIPEAKNPDKIVAKLTENATPEVKKQTEQLFAEPSKNKTTVKLNNEQTVTTPSETTREGGLEAASKYIKDSVPQKEVKEIQREDKKRRKSLDNLYNKALNMGDTERAAYIKELSDNDLYTVEHSGYEVFKETMKMLEDPETYYKQYSDKINTTDKLSTKDITKLEYMQTALYKYYADYNSPSYNPTMANSIIQDWAEEGTTVGQALAARRQMYNDDPNHVAIRTQQTLNSLFREEAKNHEGDVDWLNKNDPMKNSDSPYHMSDTQLATVNYYANKLGKMEDKTSTEYLTTYSQLDNYIQSLFGDKKLTEKMKRLTITNVLASTRIWTQNIKGNFVNLAQFNGVDRLVATSVDKIISNQTQMRSTGMSFEGDREFIKGYKQGVADSWTELTKDITLSKFHSKFTDSQSTDMGELGKKGFGKTFNDNTAVGKALNKYQNIVNFALDIGDRPFAQGYYAQSIHNQRMLNAQIDAQASGKNTVYYTSINNKTKMYEVRYFDSDGKKVNTFMTEDQYKTFAKTAVEEELTEQMCKIAEKEALENTYQDDNKITKAALKMKDSLNNIFHIGDFGFGDMILKFTRTGSNMAKSLYEHSPLAAAQLVKDSRALNRNIKAGTATIEMQHKVAREAGKVIGGTITMSVIGALDWAGLIDIEGEHDDDKEDKFKESTMGSQEYSVELPGGEYNYKISSDSTIGSLAKLGKTAEELMKDGNNILEVLANMTAPFTNEIIDNSFMSSILDLGSSYSDPLDNLARKVASQPSNLIPSFIKDYSIARDNYTQRTTYDENLGQYMINQIINKTPWRGSDIDLDTPIGKIKGLSSKKTAWGEIRTVGGDFLASAWNTWLTGDTLSRIKNDTISNEVIRVYTETNNTNSIPNLNTTKNFSYNNKKYDLSEKEQDKYMTTYGKTSYNAVRDLMKTNQYKNATDEQKVKLLDKAYDYAKEKAIQQYVESKGKTYYNFKKDSKTKKYTEYKKSVFEEIIENDISIEEASYKRKYNNSYKLKTSITGLENYLDIAKNIKEIKKAYSKDNGFDYKVQKYVVQTYINELQGMSSVQKAMLSKLEHSKSDYANYDDKILSYIKSLDLTDEEYQYMYKELGLGGYWAMYYKTKKNKN